ncbi:hypothetical protein GGI12_004155, partial [Dipsacomyces acuminosporus]
MDTRGSGGEPFALDELATYVYAGGDANSELDAQRLMELILQVHSSPDRDFMNMQAFEYALEFLPKLDSLGTEDAYKLLQILIPNLGNSVGDDGNSQAGEPDSNTGADGAGADVVATAEAESQRVPEAAARQSLGIAATPLDLRRRTHTPLTRRQPFTTTAEGTKLRHRNIAALTDEEFDTVANSIQPELVNTLSTFAARSGISPPRNTNKSLNRRATTFEHRDNSEQAILDHHSLSDSEEQSGFSTPHVSRKAIRQRLHSLSRLSPTAGAYDVPGSPTSPSNNAFSPLARVLSPTHLADADSNRKHIEELLNKKAELQKLVGEKERRLELMSDQNEKQVEALERELDECKAELTMKKREIEKLKASESSYVESLKVAEREVDRLGLSLSNSAALSNDLKRQLEAKASQAAEASSHLFEHQAEIASLKSNLNANYQQQELLSKEYNKLELQFMELKQELQTAKEFRSEADAANRENAKLSSTIENLRTELTELRIQLQSSADANANANNATAADSHRRGNRKYKSLQDELAQSGAQDLSGVDDVVYSTSGNGASRRGELILRHRGCQTQTSLLLPASKAVGTTADDEQRMSEDAVRDWISKAMAKCSSEDLVILSEVWKRIGYCDVSTENQERLRHELMAVFMAPYKYGLKEAIRSRSNATLTRIVDNVSGEATGMRMSAGHHYGKKGLAAGGKGAPGIAQLVASGQHTTAVIILYSVVVFCLGIITASYFNISQPLSSGLPFGLSNNTMATA